MKFLILSVLCCLAFTIVFGDISGPGCSITLTTTARSGAFWLDGDGQGISQIYDIVATNSGPCSVDKVVLSITKPTTANITQSWNLDFLSPRYSVTNFGSTLLPGSSAIAGFILHFPNRNTVPSGVTSNLFNALCPASCVNSQGTTGSGSGSGTVSGSTTGVVSGSNCAVTVSSTPRAGGSFPTQDGISQIYDILVSNSGPCAAFNLNLNLIKLASATMTQNWNLQSVTASVFALTNYGGLLQPGQTASAGFILDFPSPTIPSGTSVTLNSKACTC